jgi:hypothetical protein
MLLLSLISDPIRDQLQARADHLSVLVGWANITVAIGVAFEGIEICHDIVAWAKRKRREKRELIVLKELAEIFPVSKATRATGSHSDEPRWVKRLLRIGLIIVVIGVVGEWRCGAKLEDAHNAIHEYDVAKLTAAEKAAGDAAIFARIAHEEADAVKGIADEARADAKDALTKAQAAQRELAHAEADAAKAQTVASRALSTADKAESHLAEALKQAADATAELNRLKTPRSLTNASLFTEKLKQFKGTEYTFAEVFADEESVELLKQIDSALQLAEWKRVKPSSRSPGGIALNVYGDKQDFGVPPGVSTSVLVSVDSTESVDSLKSRSPEQWPAIVRAAVALKGALAICISPEQGNKGKDVVVESGTSMIVRITVGKKP